MGRALTWSAIVVLLVGLVFFRPAYLYWIIWFWIASGLVCLWDAWDEWQRGRRGWGILRNTAELCVAGVAFGGLMFAVSPHFVRELLFYNYADRYSAFRVSRTFGEFLSGTFASPGILGILLFVGGLAYAFWKPGLRKFAGFQIIQLAGIVVHFGRTQDFGPHHHYLLLAVMLPLATLFVAELLGRFRWMAAGAASDRAGGIRVVVHVAVSRRAARAVPAHRRGGWRAAPAGRPGGMAASGCDPGSDPEFAGTRQDLRFGQQPDYQLVRFAPLDCSLNESFAAPKSVCYSAEIDKKRDGFPADLLRAKYVSNT